VSIDVTIICDGCGAVLAGGGRSAANARRDVVSIGGRVNLPGGKDLCRQCISEGRQPE
jgi:deoxyinosine 3'endonuclease (endonuclease V)